jgi:hypothetical protein
MVGICVCAKMCEICWLFEDLLAFQELLWAINLVTYYNEENVHAFIATEI